MVGQPVYKKIFDDLLGKIHSGHLKPGDRLPSELDLCRTYDVSRITGKKALELLAAQGYISRSPGKGSFVISAFGQSGDSLLKAIGFVLPDFSEAFGNRLLYGIEESCTQLGYHLILKRTRDQAGQEEEAIKSLSGAAGILLLPVHGEFYNPEILKLILNRRPLVFVDRKLRGLAAPTVTTGNIDAAQAGAKFLVELGHRNIAFFSGPLMHTSTVEDRYQGFLRALTQFKISHNPAYLCQELSSIWTWPFYSPERISGDIRIAAKLLKDHPEISAAFTAEYAMAVIVKTAAESLGRVIPKNFSILTFDAPPLVTDIPPITHICQDEYTIGKESVQALHRIITGSKPGADIMVPANFVKGASTGPNEARKSKNQPK